MTTPRKAPSFQPPPTTPSAAPDRRPKCPACGYALYLAHWDTIERQWRGQCDHQGCPRAGGWVTAKARAPHEASEVEERFLEMIKGDPSLPIPVAELYFHEDVGWRLDFAWLNEKVAVELQGGIWMQAPKSAKTGKRVKGYSGSRHLHPAGYARDCYKYNAATAQGWRLVYLAEPHLRKREYVISLITDLLS